MLVGSLVRGCRCAASWFDLDLTFNLVVVTFVTPLGLSFDAD